MPDDFSDFDDTVDGTDASNQSEILTSWHLITAGNGGDYERIARAGDSCRWRRLGHPLWILNDAEITAMGPVRRAVVVTLPDHIGQYAQSVLAQLGPEPTRDTAAEMLAAALHAVEGEK